MNPTVTGRPSRCAEPSGGLEALAHGAGVVRTGRGEHDGVARRRVRGRARRSASTATMRSSGPSSSASWAPPPIAVEPEREPGAHVEARGEHERHDDRVGLRGGGRAAAATSRFAASTKLMETSSSGRSDATPSTRRITASRFSAEGAPWVTATRRSGCAPRTSAGSPAPLDPTMCRTRASPAESGLTRRFRRYARRVSRTAPACFRDVKSASRAARRAARRARARRRRLSRRAARAARAACARPAARGATRRSHRGCPRAARAARRARATTAGFV